MYEGYTKMIKCQEWTLSPGARQSEPYKDDGRNGDDLDLFKLFQRIVVEWHLKGTRNNVLPRWEG